MVFGAKQIPREWNKEKIRSLIRSTLGNCETKVPSMRLFPLFSIFFLPRSFVCFSTCSHCIFLYINYNFHKQKLWIKFQAVRLANPFTRFGLKNLFSSSPESGSSALFHIRLFHGNFSWRTKKKRINKRFKLFICLFICNHLLFWLPKAKR